MPNQSWTNDGAADFPVSTDVIGDVVALLAIGAATTTVLNAVAAGFAATDPALMVDFCLPRTLARLRARGPATRLPGAFHAAAVDYCNSQLVWPDLAAAAPYTGGPTLLGSWRGLLALAAAHGVTLRGIFPVRGANGAVLGLLLACSEADAGKQLTLSSTALQLLMLTGIALDRHAALTELNSLKKSLHDDGSLLRLAVEGSGTGIWDRNVESGEVHYSPQWKAIIGYQPWELSNWIEDAYLRIHPEDLPIVRRAMQEHFDLNTLVYEAEHRLRCKDGTYKWVLSRGRVVSRDEAGTPLRMVGTTTDISATRALSERLRNHNEKLVNVTNDVPGLVYQQRRLADGATCFSYASDAIRDIFELTPEQVAVSDACVLDRLHPDDRQAYVESLAHSAANLVRWHHEFRVELPRQGLAWRLGDAWPRRMEDGSTLWHGFIIDTTARKEAELELETLARVDYLTQLPNRRHFMERLEIECGRIKRRPELVSTILMFDIDHFKCVNDTHGHAAGDIVLQCFGRILKAGIRDVDAIGRVGGEEFAIILAGAGLGEGQAAAARIQEQIGQTPFVAGDATFGITASIGIAVMTARDANGTAALTRADLALYDAKRTGRNRVQVFAE